MKIKLDKDDQNQLKILLQTKENNMASADMFLYYLSNAPRAIKRNLISAMVASQDLSEEFSFYCLLMDVLGIDLNNKNNKQFAKGYVLKGIRKLDLEMYLDNPYYQNIKAERISYGKWELRMDSYAPYEGFIFDDVSVDENNYFQEITNLGFFDREFSFLSISEADVVWMSVTPNEIATMQPSIDLVRGKVVTFGLGLGYFAYMASIKDDVDNVTIIEKDKDVIEIFTKFILPKFSHQEKIHILEMDAFEYAKIMMAEDHNDFAFVDLWHGAEDGISLYLEMKKYESLYSGTKFLYWLEESMLAMLRRCVLTIVEEQSKGATDTDYQKAANKTDEIINKLYFILKETKISGIDDLIDLLADDSLKDLANRL